MFIIIVIIDAEEIVLLLEIPEEFNAEYQARKRLQKTHFNYENPHETPFNYPERI